MGGLILLIAAIENFQTLQRIAQINSELSDQDFVDGLPFAAVNMPRRIIVCSRLVRWWIYELPISISAGDCSPFLLSAYRIFINHLGALAPAVIFGFGLFTTIVRDMFSYT